MKKIIKTISISEKLYFLYKYIYEKKYNYYYIL